MITLMILLVIGLIVIFYEVDKMCYEREQKAIGERRLYRRYIKAQDRRQSC